jgi:type IV secretory pathway VirB10-like protein
MSELASSTLVIQNLAYLVGAIVLAIVIGLVVWLRHRPPRSVDANVESFHRGLRALAPDSNGPVNRPVGLRIQPPHAAEPAQDEEDVPEPDPADPATEPVEAVEDEAEAPEEPAEAAVAPETTEAAEAQPDPPTEVVDLQKQEADDAAAGEAAGDWAGVETG